MISTQTHTALAVTLSALPAGSVALGGRRPLYAVPVDGGWTAYTPDGAGFRTFGELVFADRTRLAAVMAAY